MTRHCEVCDRLGQPAQGRLRYVVVEQRLLSLCSGHARVVRASGAATLAAVRALFREPKGNRSALSRRAELDRRAFPPRPEGRRRGTGRRATDLE